MGVQCPSCKCILSQEYLYITDDYREYLGKRHSVRCAFCGCNFTFKPEERRDPRKLYLGKRVLNQEVLIVSQGEIPTEGVRRGIQAS